MTEESKKATNLDSLPDNDDSKIKMECNDNAGDDGDSVKKQPPSKKDSCTISDKENVININDEIFSKDDVDTVLSNLDINIHDNHGLKETLEPSDVIIESKETVIEDEDDDNDDNDFETEKFVKLPQEEVESDPNFAIICSFFEKFGSYLELEYSIENLKDMFEENNKDLIDLHIKLLRKRRKYINKEKWEKALKSFCAEYSSLDEWKLETFGYQNAKLSLRLRILVRLLEAMFDHNQKFKSELNNSSEANNLRVPPFGRDITGYTYWYQIDSGLNFRLYKDEPDEECSWSLVAKNIEELNECIQELENISYEDFKCLSTPNSEESNSNHALNLLPKLEPIIENEEESINNDGDQPTKSSNVKSEDEKVDKGDIVPIKEEENPCQKQEKQEIQSEFDEEKEAVRTYQNELMSVEEELDPIPAETTVEEEISFIYESILDKLEEENGQVSSQANRKKPSRGKKGRGRGKGRKYGNRKSLSKEKVDDSSETQKDQEIKDDQGESEPKENGVSVAESHNDKSEVAKTQVKNTGRKRRTEIEKLQENFAEGLTVKRSSRRIQALQEKKLIEIQEEQKKLEKELQEKRRKKEAADAARAASILAASLACDRSNDSSDHRKSKRRKKKESSDEDYQKDSDDDEELNEKKRKKSKKGKGRRKKGANPWEESGDSEDEKHENVYEDDYYDEILDDDHDELKFDDNEDEFACEEIDPDDEPVIIRRARTVKKSKDDLNDFDLETVVNDDKPCGKCGKYDNPHWILLCDKCDDGYHTSCLRPPLFLIPSGEWFCPPCEHKLLLEKLQLEYKRLSEELESRAFEKKKQKKRWKYAHCDISSENILEGIGDELIKNEDFVHDVDGGEPQEKTIHPRKSKIKLILGKPNGYLKDKDGHALMSDDENSNSISEDDDSNEEDEDDDESSAISSEDEIGKIAFSDIRERRRNRHHHRDKKRKEKRVDINDYSRSGLKLRSARRRKPINYRFKEFDDMIKSAILQEEGEEEEYCLDGVDNSPESGLPRSKGKDIENILKANAEMPDFSINPFETSFDQDQTIGNINVESESKASIVEKIEIEKIDPSEKIEKKVFSDDDDDDDDSVRKKPNQSKNRKKIKKKSLTNLDFSDDEAEEDHASDEDFKMADDDDELDEELTEIEEDAAGDTETESDSDFRTSTKRRSTRIISRRSSRKRKRTKKAKRLKRKFLVDSDEEEDEDDDDEEEEEDDISSEDDAGSYSDESSDYMPHPRRAALNKRYREDSSTDDDFRKPKDKYQEDEDYHEFDDDDDDAGGVKTQHSKKKEPEPKLNPSVLNYSQECRAKKRKRVIDDYDDDSDEPVAEENDGAKVDDLSKSGGEKITGKKPDSKLTAILLNDKSEEKNVDEDKSTSANDQRKDIEDDISRNRDTTKPMSSIKNEENKAGNLANSAVNQSMPEANSNKAESIKKDQSAYYPAPPQSSSVQFHKTVDPLNSIQQMNSKFDYVNLPSTTTTGAELAGQPPVDSLPPPPMPSAYPGAPPGPPPPPIHFQRHPYHPQNSVQAPPPYSNITTPYNPPPNTPGYPLPPPSQQQQYLARPPPAGPPVHGPSYSGQQHPMAPPPHYPQQSSPIRTHLSSHPPPPSPTQNVYNPGLYAQPPRYPAAPVSTAVPVPPSGEKCDGGYTLTNLDSYNKPANYPQPSYGQPQSYAGPPRPPPPSQLSRPSASSSPQILNLDSGTCNSYPPYSAARPPSKPPPPPPHYYAAPGYENMVRPPPPPDYYGTHPPHPAPSGVASPGFYPSPGPPPGMHHAHVRRMQHPANPFPHQGNPSHPPPPPHYMPRNTSPRHQVPIPQPPSSYSTVMVANNLPQPTTTASSSSTTVVRPALIPPPPTSTYASPTGQNVAYPPQFPQYPPVQSYPPPPPYPPSSNGGFMIQNILLNRPTVAKQPPVCAVKSAPKATKSTSKTKKTKEPSNVAASVVGGKAVEMNPAQTTGSSNSKSNQSKAKGGGGRNKKAKNQSNVAGGEAAQI